MNQNTIKRGAWRWLTCALLVLPSTAFSAEQALEQAADDPTASLMNVQLSNWYTSDYHNIDDKNANSLVLRAAIPFRIGDQAHIMRATVPLITDNPFQDEGLSDMTVFDLMTFNQQWGRWGAGLVGLLPTGGDDRGAEKWALGPAFGFTARAPGFLWGVFNQNIFTVAGDDDREDVNVSILQPIINISLGHGWSTGLSEMTATYDWEENEWSSLPLGIRMAKLHRFGNLPVQFNAQYEYNFADDQKTSAKEVFRFTVKFLFPTP